MEQMNQRIAASKEWQVFQRTKKDEIRKFVKDFDSSQGQPCLESVRLSCMQKLLRRVDEVTDNDDDAALLSWLGKEIHQMSLQSKEWQDHQMTKKREVQKFTEAIDNEKGLQLRSSIGRQCGGELFQELENENNNKKKQKT